MISVGEAELICDLAETYSIYDYRRVPIRTLGILCTGLRHNSRIMLKLSEQNYDLNTMLLASIADSLHDLLFVFGGDKNAKRPQSYVEMLSETGEKRTPYETFRNASDFENRRSEILQNIKGENKT